MPPAINTKPTPLVIGITGHRDLVKNDIPALANAFKRLVLHLQAANNNAPVTILSSLAAGADLLAAKMAMSMKMEVIAPLPLPVEDYLNDFDTEKDKADFLEVLNRCKAHFVAEEVLPPQNTNGKPITARDLAYFSAAFYVVANANILVAFWNGEDNDYLAGTAKTIKMMIEKYVPVKQIIPNNEPFAPEISGFVYHISTPRKKSKVLTLPAFSIIKLSNR